MYILIGIIWIIHCFTSLKNVELSDPNTKILKFLLISEFKMNWILAITCDRDHIFLSLFKLKRISKFLCAISPPYIGLMPPCDWHSQSDADNFRFVLTTSDFILRSGSVMSTFIISYVAKKRYITEARPSADRSFAGYNLTSHEGIALNRYKYWNLSWSTRLIYNIW